jgi:hypothetical protein
VVTDLLGQLPGSKQVRAGTGIVTKVMGQRPEQDRQLPSDPVQPTALIQRLGTVEERLDLFQLSEDPTKELAWQRVWLGLREAGDSQLELFKGHWAKVGRA